MRLLTLLAGYAAGLAVAMKYRKQSGDSKLPDDLKKSTLDNFLDEVVDIHKDAFSDAKKLFETHFQGVNDLPTLQAKVEEIVTTFITEVEQKIDALKAEGNEKKVQAESLLESTYEEKLAMLEGAKTKALELAGTALDTIEPWILEARKKLDANYKKSKTKTNKIQ